MKILWIGDAVVQSGFSVVTHNICNELVKKCELVIYGIRYDGMKRHNFPYYIYPAQTPGDMYNFDYSSKAINDEKPDVIILFNDDYIIRRFLDAYIKAGSGAQTIPLFPVNLLPVEEANMLALSDPKFGITETMCYTEFSKKKINEINPNISVTAIYHGVDRKTFFPIKNRKKKLGLEKYFVVGNVGVNGTRKRLDLFLKGFAKFARDKDDVKCLIHTGSPGGTYNVVKIARDLHIADKLIFSPGRINLADMNALYNTIDVNCLTCVGEGFGLSLVEGAACGTPMLCPEHGNLVDIWQDSAEYIRIGYHDYIPNTNYIADIIDIDNFASKLNKFYEDREYTKMKGEQALQRSRDPKFDWKTVADKVFDVICRTHRNAVSLLSGN